MPEENKQSELPTSPPSPKEFWAIYPHTQDWQILLVRLVQSLDPTHGEKPLDPKIAVMGWHTNPNQPQIPIYYLSREFFPVEKIAAFLGKQPEALAGVEEIHLREFKGADGKAVDLSRWEKPSVDYWGFA